MDTLRNIEVLRFADGEKNLQVVSTPNIGWNNNVQTVVGTNWNGTGWADTIDGAAAEVAAGKVGRDYVQGGAGNDLIKTGGYRVGAAANSDEHQGRCGGGVPATAVFGSRGGMTGVLLAVPPADFVLHNSLFLIAHFHNVIIGGVLFGMFAGINFWFPKAFGFKLDKFWGTISFWFWVVGFYVAFMPLYVLGLMGVTRRLRHFEDPSLQIWFIVAAIGALLIAVGIGAFLMQIFVSIKNRDSLRDETGDPWQGRSLEWATSSPPPAYNFAFTPVVRDVDAWYDMKANNAVRPTTGFRDIHMPRNTGTGVILAGLAVVFGLAMIWYMWWLAILSFVGIVAVSIGHTFNYDRDYYIPAEEVTACEDLRTQQLAARAAQPAQTPAMGA